MQLTPDQQRQVDAASAVLQAKDDSHSVMALAERVGALEWHLGEMLRLVAGLAAQ